MVDARHAGSTMMVRAVGGSTRLMRKRGVGSVGQCVPKDVTEALCGRPRIAANKWPLETLRLGSDLKKSKKIPSSGLVISCMEEQ